MMPPMALELALTSLSLASLITPLDLSICLTIDSALSLTLSLYFSDALNIFPIYFHYLNR